MAIKGYAEADFRKVLSEHLTPSSSIKTPERLFGRQKQLVQIQRSLASDGRQVLVYGDRGVGKTSLSLTAAYLINSSATQPIYVPCGENDGFGEVMQTMAQRSVPAARSVENGVSGGGVGVNVLGTGVNFQKKSVPRFEPRKPTTTNEALELVRYISERSEGDQIVVIDEMERMTSGEERKKFAEFIKNVSELGGKLKFIFCGIGSTVEEIIGAHPSAGRVLETIQLPRLHHDELWQILQTITDTIEVKIDREMLVRIGQLSDGFPHYVHLVGESLLWNAFDDAEIVTEVGRHHFQAGIKGALERAEATLKQQYDRATLKTRLTADYEEALWSLADTTSDRRQVKEIYDWSYMRITDHAKKTMSKEELNQRLLALRKESHGSVVVGFGSGWYGFRENILRGYVRLKAEDHGVILGKQLQ